MSKQISKELWQKIEEEMASGWVGVKFGYKGHEISVSRVSESESKTCLQVYIDGIIKGEWISFSAENSVSDKAPEVLTDVWCQKSKSIYSPSEKAKLIKMYGKRAVKKAFPNLDNKTIYYVPHFSKASVLCRQYKKLEGLELIDAYFLKSEESGDEL